MNDREGCQNDIASGVAMIGSGGHAKSTINVVRSSGHVITAVLDDDEDKWGEDFLGSPILGSIKMVEKFEQAIIAIGDNHRRREISENYTRLTCICAVHASVTVFPTADIECGVVILPGTYVGADSHIGKHAIVSANCTVAHDSYIDDYAQICPGVQLGGGARVGTCALLGLGVVVLPNVRVGDNTIVGAGSVVIEDLPDGCTAVGSPARPIRGGR